MPRVTSGPGTSKLSSKQSEAFLKYYKDAGNSIIRKVTTEERDRNVAALTDVAVLGGGITGLASTFLAAIRYPKAQITLIEAGSRLGGWLRSTKVNVGGGDVVFEQGPRTLRPGGGASAIVMIDLV